MAAVLRSRTPVPARLAILLLACAALGAPSCARWQAVNRAPVNPVVDPKWISDEAIEAVKVQIGDEADRFSGETWTRVTRPDKPLEGAKAPVGLDALKSWNFHGDQVRFSLLHFEPRPDAATWAVEIGYSGRGWADLDGTIFLLLDGKTRAQLAGQGSEGNRSSSPNDAGDIMTETERVVIADSLVASLARAHSVEVRVEGASKVLDRWFDAETFASVRAMARRYALVP